MGYTLAQVRAFVAAAGRQRERERLERLADMRATSDQGDFKKHVNEIIR